MTILIHLGYVIQSLQGRTRTINVNVLNRHHFRALQRILAPSKMFLTNCTSTNYTEFERNNYTCRVGEIRVLKSILACMIDMLV